MVLNTLKESRCAPAFVDGKLKAKFVPNKRAADKRYLGGFVEEGFKAKIARAARKAGMANNLFGFAVGIIQEPLRRRLIKLKRVRSKTRRLPK